MQNAFLTGLDTYSFNASSTLTLQLDLNEVDVKSLSKAEQDFYRTIQKLSITLADHTRKGTDQEYFLVALEIADLIIPFEFERKGTKYVKACMIRPQDCMQVNESNLIFRSSINL